MKDAGAGAQGGDAAERQRPSDPLLAGLPDKGLPVCVAFGTEYGFSKEIAQKLCQQLKARGCLWVMGSVKGLSCTRDCSH